MKQRQLVYQALVCPDGHILESLKRHDYRYHEWEGGAAFLDGGLEYSNMGGDINLCNHITVYLDEPFERVRSYAYRLQGGKATHLNKMSSKWLDAAIEYELTYKTSPQWHLVLLIAEQQYRLEHEIYIEDRG